MPMGTGNIRLVWVDGLSGMGIKPSGVSSGNGSRLSEFSTGFTAKLPEYLGLPKPDPAKLALSLATARIFRSSINNLPRKTSLASITSIEINLLLCKAYNPFYCYIPLAYTRIEKIARKIRA